jgi:predicted permease
MIVDILLNILGPILLMVAAGVWLRATFKVDLGTLSKLNIYLFTPAFIFDKVSSSSLSWGAMGGVVAITVAQVATLGLMIWIIGRALKIHRKTLAAIAMAVMFYNSGNYGLPLAELAYPRQTAHDGGAVQAFVVMTQNVLTFTVGLTIAAYAHAGDLGSSILKILRMPVLYTLTCAVLGRLWLQSDPSHHFPVILSKTVGYLSLALVPTALVTLGAQLASNPRWPRWRPVSMVLVIRLLFGPVQMGALLYGFHLLKVPSLDLWGNDRWPAELLILTAAVPTAINTLLLTLELGGDADLSADCVFWTTVFSAISIPFWLIVLRVTSGQTVTVW